MHLHVGAFIAVPPWNVYKIGKNIQLFAWACKCICCIEILPYFLKKGLVLGNIMDMVRLRIIKIKLTTISYCY